MSRLFLILLEPYRMRSERIFFQKSVILQPHLVTVVGFIGCHDYCKISILFENICSIVHLFAVHEIFFIKEYICPRCPFSYYIYTYTNLCHFTLYRKYQ
jgi:hypothetical protein